MGFVLDGFPCRRDAAFELERLLSGRHPLLGPLSSTSIRATSGAEPSKEQSSSSLSSFDRSCHSCFDAALVFDIPDEHVFQRANGWKWNPETNESFHPLLCPIPESYTGNLEEHPFMNREASAGLHPYFVQFLHLFEFS